MMKNYVAFLRGINVGGHAKVDMKTLAALCTKIGLREVKTYINSGNVIFRSDRNAEPLRAALERAVTELAGREVKVILRTAEDLKTLLDANPFPNAEPAKVGVLLMHGHVGSPEFGGVRDEQIKAARSEVFIHYPSGMGRSKLKGPPELSEATMRNMNTIRKVVDLALQSVR
jgi:uncharacterized protein (DUF1697 family)